MTEQGVRSPHSLSRHGQSYSPLGAQIVESVSGDEVMGSTHQATSQLGQRRTDQLNSLVPIFPPQNFDVPDISFSNSVSPHAGFNQSLLNSGRLYRESENVFSGSGQQQSPYCSASQSPPGSSSGDDSDDVPLAQLAKRVVAGVSGAASADAVASPLSLTSDTNSMEGSPGPASAPKSKQAKKKKKRDPSEPQKPVSAYALFFRDTQATIKGHNPSASFGEVSKIVASMWDQLDSDRKEVYKKRTEDAKKQYLKQLAAYRASQVSQSGIEEIEILDSPPASSTSPPAGSIQSGANIFQTMEAGPPAGIMNLGQQRPYLPQQSPPHVIPGTTHVMQGIPQVVLPQLVTLARQSPQHSPSREGLTMGSGSAYSSPPHAAPAITSNYQTTAVEQNNSFGFSDTEMMETSNHLQCVRSGCTNQARENPAWDLEYCSNECVITHCRDIFKNWVSSRSGSNSYPIK